MVVFTTQHRLVYVLSVNKNQNFDMQHDDDDDDIPFFLYEKLIRFFFFAIQQQRVACAFIYDLFIFSKREIVDDEALKINCVI